MGKRLLWNDKGLMGNGVQNPVIEGDHLSIEEVRLGVAVRKEVGLVRGRKGEDGANVLPTRTAVENATQTYTVPPPPDSFGPHHAHLQTHIDDAIARGFKRVRVPSPTSFGPAVPWRTEDSVTVASTLEVDGRDSNFQHNPAQPNRPLWHVPATADGVRIDVGHAYTPAGIDGGGDRPTAAQYPAGNVFGAPARAAYSGVLSYGSRGTFTGRYSGFRNGVRTGVTGSTPAFGNKVDITVNKVDFGHVFFAQRDFVSQVRGSYMTTVGSDEPAHLIYGTWHAVPSSGGTVNGEAWDSIGGVAFIFKGCADIRSDRLVARNCSGILTVGSGRGDHSFSDVVGVALTGTYTRADGTAAYVEAIRGEYTLEDTTSSVDVGKRTIKRALIDIASTANFGELRAISFLHRWSCEETSITYETNEVSSFIRLIEVAGNSSSFGPIQIVNRGTGGVRGLRYGTNTTGHSLSAPPSMSGVTVGVTMETGVQGVFNVDESLISTARATDVPVVVTAARGCVVRGFRQPRRRNRWYAVPRASATEPARANVNNLHAIPVSFEALTVISEMAVTVVTPQDGGSVRFGVYADDAGAPGARLIDAGAVAATTVGEKVVTLATPLRLVPGDYWICYVVQGASNVTLSGASGMSMDVPAQTATQALTGATVVVAGQSGALPATFGTLVSSSTTTARVAYKVPS